MTRRLPTTAITNDEDGPEKKRARVDQTQTTIATNFILINLSISHLNLKQYLAAGITVPFFCFLFFARAAPKYQRKKSQMIIKWRA